MGGSYGLWIIFHQMLLTKNILIKKIKNTCVRRCLYSAWDLLSHLEEKAVSFPGPTPACHSVCWSSLILTRWALFCSPGAWTRFLSPGHRTCRSLGPWHRQSPRPEIPTHALQWWPLKEFWEELKETMVPDPAFYQISMAGETLGPLAALRSCWPAEAVDRCLWERRPPGDVDVHPKLDHEILDVDLWGEERI